MADIAKQILQKHITMLRFCNTATDVQAELQERATIIDQIDSNHISSVIELQKYASWIVDIADINISYRDYIWTIYRYGEDEWIPLPVSTPWMSWPHLWAIDTEPDALPSQAELLSTAYPHLVDQQTVENILDINSSQSVCKQFPCVDHEGKERASGPTLVIFSTIQPWNKPDDTLMQQISEHLNAGSNALRTVFLEWFSPSKTSSLSKEDTNFFNLADSLVLQGIEPSFYTSSEHIDTRLVNLQNREHMKQLGCIQTLLTYKQANPTASYTEAYSQYLTTTGNLLRIKDDLQKPPRGYEKLYTTYLAAIFWPFTGRRDTANIVVTPENNTTLQQTIDKVQPLYNWLLRSYLAYEEIITTQTRNHHWLYTMQQHILQQQPPRDQVSPPIYALSCWWQHVEHLIKQSGLYGFWRIFVVQVPQYTEIVKSGKENAKKDELRIGKPPLDISKEK